MLLSFKNNKLLISVITAFIVVAFNFFSYNFFINNYEEIEDTHNEKNIQNFLQFINMDLDNLLRLNQDYAIWDSTYDFMLTKNPIYIKNNLVDESETLENLDIDFIIFEDKNEKLFFSKYKKNTNIKDEKFTSNFIINKYKNEKSLKRIIPIADRYFFITKTAIKHSNSTGKNVGHLYFAKEIKDTNLQKLSLYFTEISFPKSEIIDYSPLKIKTAYNQDIEVHTIKTSLNIINHIHFMENENVILDVETKTYRKVVNQGKNTITIFNFLITLFSLITLYMIYRNQKNIEKYNYQLEVKLAKRSNQFEKSLRKLKKANRLLYDIAHTDYLTKIHNRRNFFLLSEKAFNMAREKQQEVSLTMFDIDFFKSINDTYGHDVGDMVLVHLAEVVKTEIDEKAIFGRLGGEEFAITFVNTDMQKVLKITEKIRSKIEHSGLALENGERLYFTASFGVYGDKGMSSVDAILSKCDELLYEAKRDGKNRVYSTTVRAESR